MIWGGEELDENLLVLFLFEQGWANVLRMAYDSNGIRNDLIHPNEYISGATLRFLCKVKDPELLEPLLSSARQCLEHRHAYVRKNAVLAIQSIYVHSEHL